MSTPNFKTKSSSIQINGPGLFSKGDVTVSVNKANIDGVEFILNGNRIKANVNNVGNANRNTVLTNGKESICLVEHFLGACSLLGVDGIEVITNSSELVFQDGSAIHWKELLEKLNSKQHIKYNYELNNPIYISNGNKTIAAIPSDVFKVSYFMDYDHPALGKLWATWEKGKDDPIKILRARTFATKEENDFFGVSDKLLTLLEDRFNMELYEPLEPVYHKILDIIGDLRLSGINPLEIKMHVIGFKSGHALNIEMARKLKEVLKS